MTALFRFEQGLAPVYSFLVREALPEDEAGAQIEDGPLGSILLVFLTCPIGCPIWFAETLDACGNALWIQPYEQAWSCILGNCEYEVELLP